MATSPSEEATASLSAPQQTYGALEGTSPVEMSHLASTADSSMAPNTKETAQPSQEDSSSAIEALGPAVDRPIGLQMINTSDSAITRSVLGITLMLTTGARHPYKIDEKYLRSRKVEAVDPQGHFDPREISGYQLKELIWTDWREEWEPRPASPSAIRLISMGRLLEDKSMLRDYPLKLDDMNILHMTVKPADFLDDDEGHTATGKGHNIIRARDGGDRDAGCRCVIL